MILFGLFLNFSSLQPAFPTLASFTGTISLCGNKVAAHLHPQTPNQGEGASAMLGHRPGSAGPLLTSTDVQMPIPSWASEDKDT
jgi:hypothetical protein